MTFFLMKEEDSNIELEEKRQFRRIPVNIDVTYHFNDIFYSGTVLNISENGLFLSTRKSLPLNSLFVVIINAEKKLLKLIGRVKRSIKNNGYGDGVAIALFEPPGEYKMFVKDLKKTTGPQLA